MSRMKFKQLLSFTIIVAIHKILKTGFRVKIVEYSGLLYSEVAVFVYSWTLVDEIMVSHWGLISIRKYNPAKII